MIRLALSCSLAVLFLAVGCSHSSPAGTTPSASGRTSSTYTPILNRDASGACSLTVFELEGQPAFLVEGPGGYGVLVPGTPEAWSAECPTGDPRMPFFGEAQGDDVVFGISLEVASHESDEAFDERTYLALQVALQVELHGATDLGPVELPNGHAGHFTGVERTLDDGSLARSVHGYAARRLDEGHVVLLHVSQTADEPSVEDLATLLTLFGKTD